MVDALARIEELCEERNWTIYRLAQEAGVSESTFRKCKERNNQPSRETIERCCKAFGITVSEFYAADFDMDYIITNEEWEFIKTFRRLSAYWKGVVRNIIHMADPEGNGKTDHTIE